MKPKDLVPPNPCGDKTVYYQRDQKIFYVPQRTLRPENPQFNQDLFEAGLPVCLEIGSGNGEWICQKALSEPHKIWIALEMKFDRVRKIWSKMKNHQIENLWIVCAEAVDFLSHYVPKHSIDHIAINFPDPWPKKKHAKNRLVQKPFLDLLSSVSSSEAEFHLLTDDPNYAEQMRSCFLDNEKFKPLFPEPYFSSDIEHYGSSYFMRLWQEKKRSFYFFKYKNSVQNFLESLT